MDAYIVLGAAFLAIACVLSCSQTFAQQITQTSVPRAPTHKSVTIVIGNKFQEVLNASTTTLRMLRISNHNTNRDSCWVFVGSGQVSKEGGYEVSPGKEYLRYPPFVPSDAIQDAIGRVETEATTKRIITEASPSAPLQPSDIGSIPMSPLPSGRSWLKRMLYRLWRD